MTREEKMLKEIEPYNKFFTHNETSKTVALEALKWADEHPISRKNLCSYTIHKN